MILIRLNPFFNYRQHIVAVRYAPTANWNDPNLDNPNCCKNHHMFCKKKVNSKQTKKLGLEQGTDKNCNTLPVELSFVCARRL